ncbi:hypothetical protein GF366_02885 [Candidatus Peregrinibacteria bacterium]|nr:hypothetical protein [Candidatus Peregrinibacteria bacterium]
MADQKKTLNKEEEHIRKSGKRQKDIMREEREGLRKRINVGKETKEKLEESKIKNFFESVLGKGRISRFLSGVTGWFADKLGIGKKEISWEEFTKEIEKQDKKTKNEPLNLEKFIVSHRALGYGRHKENSDKAIEASLKRGEDQIEIDLRKGADGEIYLVHDSIKNEKKPEKKYTTLKEALKIFAGHKNQDVVIFFDVKEPGIVGILDEMIENIDNENKNRKHYIPLSERHFLMSFNPEILKRALEKNKKRPLMFSYLPTAKLQTEKEAEKEGNIFDLFTKKHVRKICKKIDSYTGMNLTKDLENLSIKINGKNMEGSNPEDENVLHIDSELPGKDILSMIRKTNGYICIPFTLATPEIIEKAHAEGVKVAVWDAEGIEIQRAIAQGVDLIISDRPDVMKS